MWDFMMDKSGAGRFSLRTSVSPANLHSICSTIIFTITRGWHNRLGVAAVPIASQTRIIISIKIVMVTGKKCEPV
jgi:hypothetical protein